MRQEIKISKKYDFFGEKIRMSKMKQAFSMVKMKTFQIINHQQTNFVDDVEPKTAEEIEVEDKIKKENFLDEALKFNELDIYLSNQKEGKEFTDLFNNIEQKSFRNCYFRNFCQQK